MLASSMTRRPGQPGEYLAQLYAQVLLEQKGLTTGGERFPEVAADRVWEYWAHRSGYIPQGAAKTKA